MREPSASSCSEDAGLSKKGVWKQAPRGGSFATAFLSLADVPYFSPYCIDVPREAHAGSRGQC